MREDMYRGESLTIVLRCRTRAGEAADMAGKRVDVVVADRDRKETVRFSSEEGEGYRLEVEENYVICMLPLDVADRLKGEYLVEVRVKEEGGVQIAQLPGVRIWDSIMGKDL